VRKLSNPLPWAFLAAACTSLLAAAEFGYTQTPWQSAPARPAPLPAARPQVAPTRVTNLPPPPNANARAPSPTVASEPRFGASLVIPLPDWTPSSPSGVAQDVNQGVAQGVNQGVAQGVNQGVAQGVIAPNIALPLPSPLGVTALPDPLSIPLPSLPPSLAASIETSQGPAPIPGSSPTTRPPSIESQTNTSNQNITTDQASGSLVSFKNQSVGSMQLQDFQPGELIAVVGTERILAGDMSIFVDPIIEKNQDKIRDANQEAQVRAQLTRQVLPMYAEIKAMYLEFFRDMVGTTPPQELEDTKEQILTKAGRLFYEKQVPELEKRNKVVGLAELETKLREKNMSLNALRNQFVEQVLSSELERKFVPAEFEIDREEILAAYRKDIERWKLPARARWRQITIRFDRHNSREDAEQLIKILGNQMLFGGKSFEAVAKQSSEGFTASNGGMYDWTSQGSLKSTILDQAIFAIEPNRLSQVIEDEVGFHIIEVLEREAARTTDLAESQAEIRKSLSKEKRDKATEEFRAKIMKRTPIWTRWPEDIPGSRSLESAIGE
jgi:hypothetical protein